MYEVLREQYPYTWPRGQAVKTSPFHGGNTGSNPVGVMQKLRFRVTGAFLQIGRGGPLLVTGAIQESSHASRGSLLVFCANPASRYSFCFTFVRRSLRFAQSVRAKLGCKASTACRRYPLHQIQVPPATRVPPCTGAIQESSHASHGPLLVFNTGTSHASHGSLLVFRTLSSVG